jgi:hypothetical protein
MLGSIEMRHWRWTNWIKGFRDNTFYEHVCMQKFAHLSAITMPGLW